VAIYAAVAVTILSILGPEGVAATSTPLVAAVEAGTWTWASAVVKVSGAAAALGALLALVAGVGRTSLAMARENDLPRWLASVHPADSPELSRSSALWDAPSWWPHCRRLRS